MRGLAPERLVALGRIVVATLLLIEVAFVVHRSWTASAYLLAGYYLFAICVTVLPGRLLAPARLRVFTLLVDAGIFGTLIVIGKEPAGASIVLAAFIVLASAFVWQWRGALIGATGLAALLIAVGYTHLLIEHASEASVTAAVANGDSAPPLTTGSIGFDAAVYFQSVVVQAGYVLAMGAMFAFLVVAGRRFAVGGERARLARNLHDTVLQDLTAARFSLGAISANVPDEAARAIGEVGTLLADQQRRIRQFIDGSGRPEATADRSSGDIAAVARALGRQWHCAVSVDARVDPTTLPTGIASDIELMFREAVANAVRHAGARSVRMSLEQQAGGLRVIFSDDGGRRGENHPVTPRPASLGARVEALGGRLAVRQGDAGIVIVVDLPLR